MNIIIRTATIVSTGNPLNGQKKDIFVSDGIIKQIGENINAPANSKEIKSENLHVSIGWFDLNANFRDPGYEHKEDVYSGIEAAAAGGFTGIAVMPTTLPVTQSKSEVQYIINKAKGHLVDVLPIGAVSQKLEGKILAELFDMQQHGAVAFADGKRSIVDAGLIQRALMYCKSFGGKVMTWCDDKNISMDGKVHEGETSTKLGLKGIPALAEELVVSRNIEIAEYCDAPLHFNCISTKKSVELIKNAKAKGLKITADVAAHQLFLDDSYLESFDSNYKVLPPLRTREHIDALIGGLSDGTIDAICSDHTPQDIESKQKEFDHAAFGIIGLESAYACINTAAKGKLKQEQIVEKLALSPRKILNLNIPEIKEGADANLTLFDPDAKWTFTEKDIKSKSKNTPFVGTTFTGKVIAVINNGKVS